MNNIIDELYWRGLVHNKVPGIEYQLKKSPITLYVGFDPTSDSLHIGNLIPILIMTHFQYAGHKPLIIIGGSTGMIGDPSEKIFERNLLDQLTLQENIFNIKKQLSHFFNFESGSVQLLNNYDWIKKISFLDFTRDIGKHITVNYMTSKYSVKKRLKFKTREGMSFTEFTYQLLQAYDFLYLYQKKNCILQIGGSDQWGNITTGIELIKKKIGAEVYGFTFPLIIKSDGNKFGKSEAGGNIWLNPLRTSPYEFYQFWINISDREAEKLIKIYTFLSREEIEILIKTHRQKPYERLLQHRLAKEITNWVHGKETCKKVLTASQILFNKKTNEVLKTLNEETFLSIFEGVPQVYINKETLEKGLSIIKILVQKKIFLSSNSAVRRAIKEKSILVNKEYINEDFILSIKDLIADRYLLLQYGKKKYFIIKVF